MSQPATVFLSFLITIVVLVGVTTYVSSRVRRAPSVSARDATRADVSFVVSSRPWQSALVRWCGVLFVAVGLVCLVIAVLIDGQEGTGIGGVFIAIFGLAFLWMAAGLSRARPRGDRRFGVGVPVAWRAATDSDQ